ncbi:MAG: hypothetical protein JSV77_04900 [Dehalococcoidales bacterium]|nr:MAG: hypothetical protein JSV77_04900 [Dehalococcoidales bacterium]
MKKKLALTVVIGLTVFLITATSVVAQGPENAGGNNDKWEYGDGIYIGPAYLYIGPDFWAGETETVCSDGTWIDVIEDAFLWSKARYFSDVVITEKDWVYYKFWLDKDHPVDMILADGTEYTATEFIYLKWMIGLTPSEIELVAYK